MITKKIFSLIFLFVFSLRFCSAMEQKEQEAISLQQALQDAGISDLNFSDINEKGIEKVVQNLDKDFDLPESTDMSQITDKLNEMLAGAGQDFSLGKEDKEEFLDFFQRPALMAEKLSPECKDAVNLAWQKGQHLFFQLQHPALFLLNICQDCGIVLSEFLSKVDGDVKDIAFAVETLYKMQKFLNSPNFHMSLQTGFSEELLKEIEVFVQSLAEVVSNLDNSDFQALENRAVIKSDLQILQTAFVALDNKDFSSLGACKLQYLAPQISDAISTLEKAEISLGIFAKSLSSNNEDTLEAVQFWQKNLGDLQFLKNISNDGSGFSLPSGDSKWLSTIGKIAPFVEGGYALYRKTFNFKNSK